MENEAQSKPNGMRAALWLVVIVVVAAFWFAWDKQQDAKETKNMQHTTDSGNYFAMNQECLKYKDDITRKLEVKDPTLGKATLEQIFYSSKINSCLYIEFSELKDESPYISGDSFVMKRLFDVSNDGYSSTPLEMCETYQRDFKTVQDSCAGFEEKIGEYRK